MNKNLVLATAVSGGRVLFLSDTVEGSMHDKAIADDVQNAANQAIARRWIVIEYVISGKRCRIAKDTIRLWIRSFVLDLTGQSIWDFRTTQA